MSDTEVIVYDRRTGREKSRKIFLAVPPRCPEKTTSRLLSSYVRPETIAPYLNEQM